jgi:hypothetical protein
MRLSSFKLRLHELRVLIKILRTIHAARTVQEFLWGSANVTWGIEEWLRMFRKRISKLDEVTLDNPHAAVEIKKRLLQTAALAVALIAIIDTLDCLPDGKNQPPTNLARYARSVKER